MSLLVPVLILLCVLIPCALKLVEWAIRQRVYLQYECGVRRVETGVATSPRRTRYTLWLWRSLNVLWPVPIEQLQMLLSLTPSSSRGDSETSSITYRVHLEYVHACAGTDKLVALSGTLSNLRFEGAADQPLLADFAPDEEDQRCCCARKRDMETIHRIHMRRSQITATAALVAATTEVATTTV